MASAGYKCAFVVMCCALVNGSVVCRYMYMF